jgi:hypothetical protein
MPAMIRKDSWELSEWSIVARLHQDSKVGARRRETGSRVLVGHTEFRRLK